MDADKDDTVTADELSAYEQAKDVPTKPKTSNSNP